MYIKKSPKNVLLSIITCVLLTSGCSDRTIEVGSSIQPALTVTSVSPTSSKWPTEISANGSIEAWQYSIIGSEISGVPLTDVFVEVGDQVKKGQLLAQFDDQSTSISLIEAEANLLDMEANYHYAKKQFERSEQLKSSGAYSEDALLKAEVENKSALAKLKLAQAKYKLQNLLLTKTKVRATDDGVITLRDATIGAVLNPGSELFRIIRQNRLEWRAKLDTQQMQSVTIGSEVIISPHNNVQIEGRIRKISPTLDPKTLTKTIYVDLPEHPNLSVGMFTSGKILLGESDALIIPVTSLTFGDGYEYVMTIDETSRVHKSKVITGRRQGDLIEIIQGVSPDDKLVLSGSAFLLEGDLVTIVNSDTTNIGAK